jgi:hypothetical protein
MVNVRQAMLLAVRLMAKATPAIAYSLMQQAILSSTQRKQHLMTLQS